MRRARIKAFATVPVRRKNVSQEEPKENGNAETKSTNSQPPDKEPSVPEEKQLHDTEKEKPLRLSLIKENEKPVEVKENKSEEEVKNEQAGNEKVEDVKVEREKIKKEKLENIKVEHEKIKKEKIENVKVENEKVGENELRAVNLESRNEVSQREVPKLSEVEEKSTNGCESEEKKEEEKEEENVGKTNQPRIVDIETIDRASVIKLTEKNNNTETVVESEKREKENISNLSKEIETKEQSVAELANADKKDSLQSPSNNYLEGSPLKSMSNRLCFMRPTPRLDGVSRIRRNSMCTGSGQSASESEDDSRRTPLGCRVRNDSVSSVQGKDPGAASVNVAKSATTKRRTCISASAKKLKDARQEFLLKYENKAPDKSKLKMYDLIYYNPAGSPMKKTNTGPRFVTNAVTSASEDEAEENEDDPAAMPVPQVKVGPNGQLIIDQQSLVVERTKSKVTIDRSKIIVADEYTNGGFYKKRQVRKDWSKWETLKFYKALNSIGTDFLLMQNFFPKRTRRELKLKFKKEERINGALVAKALSKYHEFDTEFLKKELLIFEENEKKELEQVSKKKKSDSKAKRKRKTKTATAAESIDADDEQEIDNDLESDHSQNDINKSVSRSLFKRPSESDEASDSSGSETEIYKPKPTRSGRLPKVRKLQAPEINTLDKQFAEKKESTEKMESPPKNVNDIRTMIPDVESIEPGSLVILTKEAPDDPGKNILQVYMVNPSQDSSDQSMTPIDLSPELLATVTTRITQVDKMATDS